MLKKIYNNAFIRYTSLFIIIGFFTFFWFLYYEKTFLTNNDGFDQYYPIIVNLRHLIKDIVHGKGMSFWDWSIGLGADRVGNFYSVYFDPFAYIIALFPISKIDLGFGIAVYIRMYAAGIAMFLFLKNRNMEQYQCLIGALSYAFCMWGMYAFFQMVFLTPFILFPLIILTLDNVDEGKSPFWFVIILAVTLINNLYFAYMTAIITAIYFMIKYPFAAYRKSCIGFFQRLGKEICYVIIAAMIASPVIVIVGYTIMNSPKGSYSLAGILYSLPDILRFIPSLVSDVQFFGNYSALSVGPVIFAMTPAFLLFGCKEHNKLPSVMLGICMLLVFFPVFGSLLNGLNYPTARWCYMLVFYYIWAGCEALPFVFFDEGSDKRKFLQGSIVLLIIITISTGIAMIFGLLSARNIVITMVYIAIMYIFAVIIKSGCISKKGVKGKKFLVLITTVSFSLIGFLHFSSILSGGFTEYMVRGEAYRQYQKSVLREAGHFEEDLYRVDSVEHITDSKESDYYTLFHWAANEPTFFNVPTTYTYYSTLDSDWGKINESVCNNPGFMLRVLSYSNDGRSRLNFLENVKYFVASNEKVSAYCSYGYQLSDALSDDERIVYKNKYNTSIGYVYPYAIAEEEFLRHDYLDREQIMMQAAVIKDNRKSAASTFDLKGFHSDTKELEFEIIENNGLSIAGNTIDITKENASMELTFDTIEDSELYISFENFKRIPISKEERLSNFMSVKHSKLERDIYRFNNIKYKPAEDFVISIKKDTIQKNIVNQIGLNNQANTEVKDYLCNVGYFENSSGDLTVSFNKPGKYQFDSIKIFAVSQKHFDEQASTLADQRFIVESFNNDTVEGTIDSKGGVLFLSILNTDGWKAYVDGKRQDIYTVNTGFIGLDVTPGKHEIKLEYSPVGDRMIWLLPIAGVFILVAICSTRRKAK